MAAYGARGTGRRLLQMPELGGVEATMLIREREKSEGGHIPIIAVTANAMV